MSDETILPLSGVTVIDFTQVFMGPCATQMLGDYGADVIKIEKVGTGDLSRTSLPGDPAGLQNPVFRSLNRNKRSIALDLKSEVGKDIVRKLVAQADVMVNNFRAGVMERMGFGYEEMAKINPRIIHATGTGFGIEGPYAHKGGQDVLAQALTGLMHRPRPIRSRSIRPPSQTIRPVCTSCRRSCSRCYSVTARDKDRRCTSRSTTASSRCRCRRQRCG